MNRPLGCLWATILCAGVAAGSQEQGSGDARSLVTPPRAQLATPDALRGATPPRAPAPLASKSQATHAQTSIIATPSAVAPHQEASRTPSNDDCANAYAFDLPLPCGGAVVFSDDNTGATEDCPALSGGVYRDVWFKFTTHETLNVAIKYCGTAPAFYNGYIVMDTTCPCSGNFIFASTWDNWSCGDGNWTFTWYNLPARTYYWPLLVDSAGGYAEGPYTVTFDTPWYWPPPPGWCPASTMYGQGPMDDCGAWAAYTSAVGPNFEYTCYENFSGLTDKIGGVHWWGLPLIFHPSYGWMPCGDPSTMTFEIGFYQDAAGYPGTQVRSYVVQPTIVDAGPFSWTEVYYYSVALPLPCCTLESGWVSIQSQAQYLDCVFLWLNSPAGDFSAYQQAAGGSFNQLGTNLAFCLTSGDCPDIFGACCDDYTSACTDNVEWGDCLPPLRFTPDTLCADLAPPCGISGACCDAGLNCVGTVLEAECAAIYGWFFPGQTCPEWVCPAECEHRIDLKDCYGDGWNGNTLDVLVNGVTVLSQITLPSGAGPLSYTFQAATGDTIQTIYYPIGSWPHEPYYYIYDRLGFLLGQDGIIGTDCNYQPTGITVYGNCFMPTTGACCDEAGGCELVAEAQCVDGEFLGLGTICVQCPCYVPCPPEGIPEPEPCGTDQDGGCDVDPPAFVPIACGDTICGTTWASPSLRDTDWYQVVTDGWKCFTWTATGHAPLRIAMVAPGPEGCVNAATWYLEWGAACQPVTIGPTISLPAGEYWFWVSPLSYEDWPCDQNYAATLTCQDCPVDYCLAGATYEWEYISRVRIDTLENLSGCEPGQYANYTYEITGWQAMLAYGAPTVLTVNSSPPIPFVCSAWVDWNQDYVFEDGGDELIGDVPGVGWYSFTIVPPASALPGRTRMRIRLTYPNPDPEPCGIVGHGEVEDYTVNVQAVAGACCWDSGACTQELPWNCPAYWGGPNAPCANNDCQPNGFDDFCDLANGTSQDCQPNGIPDECDIANCPAGELWCGDCNLNGIPDGCELWAGRERDELSWDDGSSEDSFGYGSELCPIVHFSVASPAIVQAVRTYFGTPREPGGSGISAGDPVRVYVWSDPNGDGNPADAALLAEATGVVNGGSIDTDVFQSIAINQVVSGSFFVGASVVTYGGAPVPMDGNGPQHNEAWVTFNTVPFDPTNIMANLYNMHDIGLPCNWLLRAEVTWGPPPNDCNENGIPDECDTGGGSSEDCNGNLIPDECEPGGAADCNNDGTTDLCEIAHCVGMPGCSDCNSNYVPDACDIAAGTSLDCNDNGVPDECDIAAGTSPDCNGNGVPDECDIANCPPGELWCCDCQGDGIPDGCQLFDKDGTYELLWDDGSSENSLGLTAGGELCWLVHFTLPEGEVCVAQIEVCFGTPSYPGSSGVTAGQPVRVYVWKDPNGDGNPNDAVFLGEASGTADGASIDSDSFQSIPLSPWVRVHSSFFVGASVVTTSGYPAPMDENGPQYNQAWIVFNTVPFDPVNLGSELYNMTHIGYPCNWLLRADVIACSAPDDCNGNGIPDECDIGAQWGGYCATPGANCFPPECSSDWDHNGVPDECEVCGDLDNDGNVDLDDYWMFLDAFGTCVGDPKYNPAADMDGDGCVTLVDYQAWRMCYLMANGKDFVAPKPQPMPKPAKKAS